MFYSQRQNQTKGEAENWRMIVQAWRNMDHDEDTVLVSDIVPMGFSDADLATGHQKRNTMTWVWHRA